MGKKCSIAKCVSGDPKDRRIRKYLNIKQASLFSVPKDVTLLSQWSSSLKMDLSNQNLICDYHFKEEDIIKEVRHDFPNGTYQIIPKGRWVLAPNATPVNPEPKQYGNERFTDILKQPCQQLDNRPCTLKRPIELKRQDISPQVPAERCKSIEEVINVQEKPPLQQVDANRISSESKSAVSCADVGHSLSIKPNVVPVQKQHILTDKNESLNSLKDIQCMVNIPPAWYYIYNDEEVIFVHVDIFRFRERCCVFISADMSVTVSFNPEKKYDLGFKITSRADLLKIFEEVKQASVCTGTGMKDMSSSARCNGFILNKEKYKRLPRNPRCTSCCILRHKLLKKEARRRHSASKKYDPQKLLRDSKNKCKRLQKQVNFYKILCSYKNSSISRSQ